MVITTPLMALVKLLLTPSPQPLALEEMLISMKMRPSLSVQILVSLLFMLCIVSLIVTNDSAVYVLLWYTLYIKRNCK